MSAEEAEVVAVEKDEKRRKREATERRRDWSVSAARPQLGSPHMYTLMYTIIHR